MSEQETPAGERNHLKTMLVIDDDEHFLEHTSRYFRNWIRVECVPDGLSGLVQTIKLEPDIILLNFRAAKVNCAELCRKIRDISSGLLFVLADEGMGGEERIACFEAGADDVMSSSFNWKELMLRIQVLLRRGSSMDAKQDAASVLHFGPLRMDRTTFRAFVLDQDLILTRKEFSILWAMAAKPGEIVSRQELLRRVWNYNPTDDDRMIDTHLNRLRKKLHRASERIRIKTAWGIGYKLESLSIAAMLILMLQWCADML
ncbi:response regulator transcription factor [Cohnella pontilimi]|uniref:Response regulator transcription factor n=1 Tax=Cohnella pontilimi TaxID=2564100 RepID=A0A4V6WEJ1_9BACL|nr:response regulator transcription factor [Cohnella pontilimi]TJY44159.1 response regulator transcription factor [Cohnella pontilimi]